MITETFEFLFLWLASFFTWFVIFLVGILILFNSIESVGNAIYDSTDTWLHILKATTWSMFFTAYCLIVYLMEF